MENPCNPASDCACLQSNANWWQAAHVVDSGLASYYNGLANQDSSNYYQFLMWMYQYGCGMMRALTGKDAAKIKAPEPLTAEERATLEAEAAAFRKLQVERLMKSRGQEIPPNPEAPAKAQAV